jgi:predicted  nucleic acid-binding Zn-ribbon protein
MLARKSGRSALGMLEDAGGAVNAGAAAVPTASGRCAKIKTRMNALIQKLIELQSVDLRKAELRQQIDAFPKSLAQIEQTLQTSRDSLAKAKQRVVDLHKDRKKLELDVEDWRAKIRKYKDQLYQVKSNEAYKALQEEIRGAEAEMSRAEDRLIEEMVGGEKAEEEVKQAESALAETEKTARDEREKLLAAKGVFEKEYAEADEASKTLLAGLPGDIVDHYHRIARRHGGVALAAVSDEACSMCSVRIRPHVMQLLRQSGNGEIFHCETCTRILYFVEKPAPVETTSQASAAEAIN